MGHTSGPGLHWRVPLLDYYEEVQTTIQTDSVRARSSLVVPLSLASRALTRAAAAR